VNAIAHIHVKPPRLTKQGFVAGGAAAVAVAGGVVLGIRLGFHHHAPKQPAVCLAIHQQTTDELGGDDIGGAGEERLGEVLGEGGGYGSGFKMRLTNRIERKSNLRYSDDEIAAALRR